MPVSLEEYFRTTFEDKLLVKLPEREDEHLTPATRLLEKRREMTEVEQALNAQKEEFQMKMESIQQRREELERKEYTLKESLLKFDKFLKENDAKKNRAVKKANVERDAKLQRMREIEALSEEAKQLQHDLEAQKIKLTKHMVFQKYMDKVLERADEFSENKDAILRYDTLVSTHQHLLNREVDNQDRLEREKANLLKFMEEKNNDIMSYNNQLANLQMQLETAQSAAVKWESVWTHIKNTAARQTLLLGRIKMATHNLFMLIHKQMRTKAEPSDTTEKQLQKIQIHIKDLTEIIEETVEQERLEVEMRAKNSDQSVATTHQPHHRISIVDFLPFGKKQQKKSANKKQL